MRYRSSYFGEEELGKKENIALFKRIFVLIKPHKILLLTSVSISMLGTLISLAIPYTTKIAIDSYILPSERTTEIAEVERDHKTRVLTINLNDEGISQIVDKYENLFTVKDGSAVISYESLSSLQKEDIIELRKNDIEGIGFIVLGLLGIIVLNFIFTFVQRIVMEYMGQTIMHELRMKLFRHIQKLPIPYFNRNPVARLVTRVTNDIQNMHEMFTSVLTFIFKDIFILLGIIIILLWTNWQLALACFIVIPCVIFITYYFSRRFRDVYRILRLKIAEINTKFSESISGIKIIQLFTQEKNSQKDFKDLDQENYETAIREIHLFALFMPVMEILGAVALAIIIFYGGKNVLSQNLSIGELVVFISYMKMFFRPVRDMAEKYNITQNALASAERIFLVLDEEESDQSLILDKNFIPAPGKKIDNVAFQDVGFEYVADEAVLSNVTFEISSGETIAFVGPTGSGKTTLVNLIIRFYDPISGSILINGREIQDYNAMDLRSRIALVMQDPFLFSGTIRENIITGERTVSEDELDEILALSNCKSFIEKLPHGVDTKLSEGGASISSGEKQLISIARAFAVNPDLIILDEATSYIDTESEIEIQEALSNLMRNRTSIIIAHRISTTRGADKIFVLKDGRITESGTHDELMKLEGLYYKLNLIHG